MFYAQASVLPRLILALAILVPVSIGGWWLYTAHTTMVADLVADRDEWQAAHASTSALLTAREEELALRETELAMLDELLVETQNELADERRQNNRFRDQIEQITGTVSSLDRLASTDRELLQKYSRVYFLNENYRPARLTKLPDEWVLAGREEQYFLTDAWPFLEEMLHSAQRDGVELRVLSAFRSFDEQTQLKQQFTQTYGTGANAFSADQGFSEHQLGTAVDIVDPGTGATSQSFATTEAYQWLQDNAHLYGFILSYPEGNEYYIFEPWHWRFVGRQLATDLHEAGEFFYDWDQRQINQYLIHLFE